MRTENALGLTLKVKKRNYVVHLFIFEIISNVYFASKIFLLLIHILRILKTPESLDSLKKFILIKVWQVLQEGFILNYAAESA